MESLFGSTVAPYAKAWIAFIGFALTQVAWYWQDAPPWVTVAGLVLTSLAVWAVPNAPAKDSGTSPQG